MNLQQRVFPFQVNFLNFRRGIHLKGSHCEASFLSMVKDIYPLMSASFKIDFEFLVYECLLHKSGHDCKMGSTNSRNCRHLYLWYSLSMIAYFSLLCSSADRISGGQSLRDGELIVSGRQKFVMGFFSPENSDLRYVGIWYQEISVQTVVWVANRESPVSGNNGILTIRNDGNLVVLDGNGDSVWSTNVSVSPRNTTAVLADTGDLILYSNNSGGVNDRALWQSFDDPTDTFLPDMRGYVNVPGVENRLFNSWKSASDPSPGRFSMGIDPRGSPQIVIWEGENRHWRSGHWNGLVFIGIPDMQAIFLYGFRLFNEGDRRLYFVYTSSNSSDLVKFQLLWNGTEEQQIWDSGLRQWSSLQSQPQAECDLYSRCGANGICDSAISPMCNCMTGFVPNNMDQWINGNWSGGCIRRTNLQCNRTTGAQGVQPNGGERDGFFRVEGVKLPDFLDYVGPEGITECENKCLQNCSCLAFSFVSGINCMMWSNNLIDTEHFAEGGNTLYIRLAGSELGGSSNVTRFIIIVTVVVGVFFLSVSIWLLWRHKKKLQEMLSLPKVNNKFPESMKIRSGESLTEFSGAGELSVEEQQGTGPELAYLSFSSVTAATNNFSYENKLGHGGFGDVYRGILPGCQEIAVKRLSRRSGQGLEEFKNEITLIAKLQHRNLVRILGCCIQGEEKILLYEYMANKSLDSFLFDPTKQNQLDWRKRFSIIEGVARGLLYLHRDSRLRIIHRDLKASNILLDEDMNPKISDFGMARIFGGNQNEVNTDRVVGTYGYMAPEYAMEGLFSVKSDVYSFGVLLLEIVSGRRNTSFRSVDHSNIIGYTWDLWDRGKAIDLLDPSIADSSHQNEVLKCIHIALLCVQDSAAHRPNMSAVVLMLEYENANLPLPRQPTLTSMRKSADVDLWNEYLGITSSNDVTVSVVLGR